jgi:hypothetical protein
MASTLALLMDHLVLVSQPGDHNTAGRHPV